MSDKAESGNAREPGAEGESGEVSDEENGIDSAPPASQSDDGEVFGLIVDLSQTLLNWSWEGTIGLEDKIQRVAKSYGEKDVKTLIGAETAIIQMGDRQALLKAVPGIPPLAALPRLKNWLRTVEAHKLTPVEARTKLRDVSATGNIYPKLLRIFSVMILGFAFAIDIVGTWEGCIVGLLTGILSGICFLLAGLSTGWALAAPFVAAFFVSLPIMLTYRFGDVLKADPGLLLIPALFIFIPGDAITMQAVEIMDGRWTAGAARLLYSIMELVLLAAGGLLAAAVTGVPVDELAPGNAAGYFPWWAVYPGHILFTIGTGLSFQMRWKDMPLATVVTLIVTAFAQGGTVLFGDNIGTLVASFIMVVVSCFIARFPNRSPAYVFILTPFFTLTPGSHGLRGFESYIGGQPVAGVEDFWSLITTLITIGIGIVAGFIVANKCWQRGW